jgi:GNAT superfamily N-acetyltransferase
MTGTGRELVQGRAAEITVRLAAELRGRELGEVRALLEHALPGIDLEDYERRHADRVVLVRVNGELASHAAFLDRVITVGGAGVHVVGVGGVATHARYRGRGLARLAIDTALVEARRADGVAFGLLMCPDALVPYYTSLGWQHADAPMTCQGRSGPERLPYPAMVRSLDGAAWPAGAIDLLGPRF